MSVEAIMIVISTSLIAPGWFMAHMLTMRQQSSQKRQELRLQYQIDSYRVLMVLINGGIRSKEDFHLFERAVNDIMLFGTEEQVRLVREKVQTDGIEVGGLLINMRNSLRKELRLPPDPDSGGWGMSYGESGVEAAVSPAT